MNQIEFEILDYMGKFEGGILTLIDLKYNDIHYNGTFFYTEDTVALTVDETLEKELKCDIEDYVGYVELVYKILERVVPHSELINNIDKVDLTDYIEPEE